MTNIENTIKEWKNSPSYHIDLEYSMNLIINRLFSKDIEMSFMQQILYPIMQGKITNLEQIKFEFNEIDNPMPELAQHIKKIGKNGQSFVENFINTELKEIFSESFNHLLLAFKKFN